MRSVIGGGFVVATLWAGSEMLGPKATAVKELASTVAGEAVTVVDGDTVDVAGRRYRLTGFDAPEIYHAKCGRERDQGLRAAARLIELLRSGVVVIDRAGGRDRWGRSLARLTVEGRDVGETLIAEGLARRYGGGRRRSWC